MHIIFLHITLVSNPISSKLYTCDDVSQWAHVDALLTWILIYSYNVNWLIASTPYSRRLGSADGLCNLRACTRVHFGFNYIPRTARLWMAAWCLVT